MVNSTLAAECLAAVEAAEAAIFVGQCLMDFLGKDISKPHISVMCDNRSLADALHSSTSVDNKHLRIEIIVLRE